MPEAYSVFTARLAEIIGLGATYVGGNMMAGMYLGIEDWGLIDTAELVAIGGRMSEQAFPSRPSSTRSKVVRRRSTRTGASPPMIAPGLLDCISKIQRTPSVIVYHSGLTKGTGGVVGSTKD